MGGMANVIGRRAGSLSKYAYSTSMKAAGFVWHEPTIERFIASPDVCREMQ